jgi:DNA-binding NtrC family response regulator
MWSQRESTSLSATGVGTILLVQDEEQLKVSMRRALEGGGYTVLTSDDGDQAQHISRDHQGPIDLLVTDMVLPILRGAELSKRLTTDRPEMMTLFISDYANEDGPEGVQRTGHRFLAKPFKRQVRLDLVGEILAN